jgi:hypothetical protein
MGDIALMGGFSEVAQSLGWRYHESHSVDNCVSGNTMSGATFPEQIETTWGCQNKQTPRPGGALAAIEYLVDLPLEAPSPEEREGQPAPPPQPRMPNPCKEVPTTPCAREPAS